MTAGLAIIGAGPAGMAAATLAAELGVATVLIDEQASPGGQIYRKIDNRRKKITSVAAGSQKTCHRSPKLAASEAHYQEMKSRVEANVQLLPYSLRQLSPQRKICLAACACSQDK